MGPWSPDGKVRNRDRFWELIASGSSSAEACDALGVHRQSGRRWIVASGGRPPIPPPVHSGRYLSIDERIQIADLRLAGCSLRSIASQIGRSPSTVSRELKRNGPANRGRYAPHAAEKKARLRARRPKAFKLEHRELADAVQAKLCKNWSPEQISLHLSTEYPDRADMHVAPETIYQALFRKAPLEPGLHRHLRLRRAIRKPRGNVAKRGTNIVGMTLIADRPAIVDTRLTAGHWEGDLILGSNCRSAIATLVERQSRYLVMVALPHGHRARPVRDALIAAFGQLPKHLRKTLTWDQGTELSRHKEIAAATGLDIYFCDAHSPWQRGTNENTNGLIRQYFPKGTDLSLHSSRRLNEVSDELNQRPRKTLDMATPEQLMTKLINAPKLKKRPRVATTT